MTHVVTAPYVTIKVPTISGMTLVGYYRDSPIPVGADQGDIDRLVRKGMLTEVTGPEPEPALEPEPEPVPDGRPKDYASKGEWVDYAVANRDASVAEDDARAAAELKSKADLITEYGN